MSLLFYIKNAQEQRFPDLLNLHTCQKTDKNKRNILTKTCKKLSVLRM